MKFKFVLLALLVFVGTFGCTPTGLAEQVTGNERSPVSTGDDLSLRPDNDKD
jgi:hypothetical protein